ncbi:Phosphofructokinase family protein [Trichomonas vaginalis G3]|uniref:6-phosphofructokinase n=1 Tax=Trichomonas vaginalis (strain ATCC PRA-98 / G3) TaxID=412133 RepID=A2DFT9_TRIV3|nr:6-phosphofructokinase protein [Trichomonas vaginalis G3]EAY20792.1 Phosphofructokinase family protein [Trichomonas vaginalis G3]KAI5529406.1 6-phosphofructokinase protein [Trichomonas vaginalis G3]|eukprot:XP_001581778.1 Phosphofructokinase family protein [Trichomonas vaginalis G3]
MKRIAVLSSGRDVSGANAAIRSIVRMGGKYGMHVFGITGGFRGLYEDYIAALTSRDVSGKIGKASSFIGTSHAFEYLEDSKIQRCLANLNKRSIEGLIVVGGGGSFAHSRVLADKGVPIIGIPASIQDDVVGTDICLGVDTAVNNIMDCIDHIRSCDSSRNRSFLVQVEGRHSGNLAARSALVTGAEICLIPEHNGRPLEEIYQKVQKSLDTGKTQCITIVSSGWKPGMKALANYIEDKDKENDLIIRQTILGYIQRGGSPSGFDRLLGTRMGAAAVEALNAGNKNHFISLQNSKLEVIPIEDTVGKYRPVDPALFEMIKSTF